MTRTGFPTPGPWTAIAHTSSLSPGYVIQNGEWTIAKVYGGVAGLPAAANASLIQAAPELLASLKACARIVSRQDYDRHSAALLQAARAIARSEEL